MITVRKAGERGHFDFGWLETYHTFSFGEYYDPRRMNFRALRVINEDWVQGGRGFPTHSHRDMEIITYVLEGALQHRDSTGGGSVIRHGDVQRMSAGTGVSHSEFNASDTEPVHLLQIWLMPERAGIKPSYEEKNFSERIGEGGLTLIAAPDGRDGAVTIHQDAEVYAVKLKAGAEVTHSLRPDRHAWVQVARGEQVTVGDATLRQSDAAAVSDERTLKITNDGADDAELLIFDLA